MRPGPSTHHGPGPRRQVRSGRSPVVVARFHHPPPLSAPGCRDGDPREKGKRVPRMGPRPPFTQTLGIVSVPKRLNKPHFCGSNTPILLLTSYGASVGLGFLPCKRQMTPLTLERCHPDKTVSEMKALRIKKESQRSLPSSHLPPRVSDALSPLTHTVAVRLGRGPAECGDPRARPEPSGPSPPG